MGAAISITRLDLTAWELRKAASGEKDGAALRRMLARSTYTASAFEFVQNYGDRLVRLWMRRDGPPNHEIIRARRERVARRHEPLLISGLRPTRANTWRDDLDLVAESGAQRLHFKRTRHDAVDPRRYSELR